MDLEEAAVRSQQGDLLAYEAVVRECQAALTTFIAVYCPDRNQIDEIVQRTFIWAYQHLGEYQPGTRFRAWLKEIARNLLLADLEVQKREAQTRRKYLEFLQATACRQDLAQEDGDGPEMANALRECLGGLSSDARAVVTRRYEAGRSADDIARETGRSCAAIRVTLFRIRQALRRCVEGKLSGRPALP